MSISTSKMIKIDREKMLESKYKNIRGILTILAQEPNWPNPANIYIIPDEGGFSLIDVGCGAASSIEHLQDGLRHWQLKIEQLHTPGHSPGHISLYDRKKRILLPGDLVGKSPAWYVPTAGGVIGYLDSLAKLEVLDAAVLLPAHGSVLEDVTQAIRTIQKKLLQREYILKERLQDGAKSYLELNKTLLGNSHLNFFPGCGIIESHLIKMEREGKIQREGQQVCLLI